MVLCMQLWWRLRGFVTVLYTIPRPKQHEEGFPSPFCSALAAMTCCSPARSWKCRFSQRFETSHITKNILDHTVLYVCDL